MAQDTLWVSRAHSFLTVAGRIWLLLIDRLNTEAFLKASVFS